MNIPRMSYPQYHKAQKLTHECCNYCDGNYLLLGGGKEYTCVQDIFYLLLCHWFKATVLPLGAALYTEITKNRDEVKHCYEYRATFTPKFSRTKYCVTYSKRVCHRKKVEHQRKRC